MSVDCVSVGRKKRGVRSLSTTNQCNDTYLRETFEKTEKGERCFGRPEHGPQSKKIKTFEKIAVGKKLLLSLIYVDILCYIHTTTIYYIISC